MALSVDQAAKAGSIAGQVQQLQSAIQASQQALGAGMTLISQSATAYLNGAQYPLACSFALNQTDSAAILNQLISVYQSNVNTLSAQLSSM